MLSFHCITPLNKRINFIEFMMNFSLQRYAFLALLAAALFGASTPLAKLLLGQMPPLVLAGLLYLGSGAGLLAVKLVRNYFSSAGRTSYKGSAIARARLFLAGGRHADGRHLGAGIVVVGIDGYLRDGCFAVA